MTRLRLVSGETFASGECPCSLRPTGGRTEMTRLFISLQIGGVTMDGVVDTGAPYLIVNPELAPALGLDHDAHLGRTRINIRGITTEGALHRLPVTLPATAGEALTFDATVFVPALRHGDLWDLPTFVGWFSCLERIRFAVDPVQEVIYFGEG